MNTLTERMKKYAELVGSDKLENYTYNILDDLQATVRALEVACEAGSSLIRACDRSRSGITDAEYLPAVRYLTDSIIRANQTLGKAGV